VPAKGKSGQVSRILKDRARPSYLERRACELETGEIQGLNYIGTSYEEKHSDEEPHWNGTPREKKSVLQKGGGKRRTGKPS